MKKVITLFVLLSIAVRLSHSIKCYTCMSDENEDCDDPEKHLDQVVCDNTELMATKGYAEQVNQIFSKIFELQLVEKDVPYHCLKQVTKVGERDVVIRGCQLPADNRMDICSKVFEIAKKQHVEVKHCSLCENDGCNGAMPSTPMGVVVLQIAAIATFLYKFILQ